MSQDTMNQSTTQLDADELFHFAIQASQNKENDKAVLYLKQAIEQTPDDAKLYFLLGAQHADLHMYEKAIEDMVKAITLEPSLYIAHFQLGLLYATSSRIDEAEQAWLALDKLGENDALNFFRKGLLHLARDEFEKAKYYLKSGIDHNQSNPKLNQDMQNMLNQVLNICPDTEEPKTGIDEQSAKENRSGNRFFLSAYNKETTEE